MCDVVSHSLSVAQTALWCFLGQTKGAYTQHSGLTTTQHKKPNLYSKLLTNMSTSAAAPTLPSKAAHGRLHKSSMTKPSVLPSSHIRIMKMQCNGENLSFLTHSGAFALILYGCFYSTSCGPPAPSEHNRSCVEFSRSRNCHAACGGMP